MVLCFPKAAGCKTASLLRRFVVWGSEIWKKLKTSHCWADFTLFTLPFNQLKAQLTVFQRSRAFVGFAALPMCYPAIPCNFCAGAAPEKGPRRDSGGGLGREERRRRPRRPSGGDGESNSLLALSSSSSSGREQRGDAEDGCQSRLEGRAAEQGRRRRPRSRHRRRRGATGRRKCWAEE